MPTIISIACRLATLSVEKTGVVSFSRKEILAPGKLIRVPGHLKICRTVFHNKIIGITTGCFDMLHYGHRLSLNWCKENCDILIVCLNSDASVKLLKGPGRPIQSVDLRLAALCALDCVDYVVVFDEKSAVEIVKMVKPDVFLKGGDYINKTMEESAYSGKTLIGPLLPGVSTSMLIKNKNEKAKEEEEAEFELDLTWI